MSADRRHTDVRELGWQDVLLACTRDPYVRAEGHDDAATQAKGRLVRFNWAVQIHGVSSEDTPLVPNAPLALHATSSDDVTPLALHATRLERHGDLLVPGHKRVVLTWSEWDWISWQPMLSPTGRRFKITHTGESSFGSLEIWNDTRIVDRRTNRVVGEYDDRAAAVVAAVKMAAA